MLLWIILIVVVLLLVYFSERHAIRLLDAVGLGIAVVSWLYLDYLAIRWAIGRGSSGKQLTRRQQ